VIITRFFEAAGSIRKAISILKKRSGPHESTVRELTMSEKGVTIGAPLSEYQGVLTGVPTYIRGGQ
jgi:circadian clock protein KaiC